MTIERNVLGSISVSGSTMDHVTDLSYDPGIAQEETTHLGSTSVEWDEDLPNPTLTLSGYVDTDDVAQNILRRGYEISIGKLLGTVVYTYPDENKTVTFPATAKVASYNESLTQKGFQVFSATIVANGSVTY